MQTRTGLLLNVGASSSHVDGWISLDLLPDEHGVFLDARERWPLPNGCARAIRSEHMIEHFTFDEARSYLAEVFRVLEPGGVCRTCTPDLQGIVHEYLQQDSEMLALHREHGYDAPTWAHFVNNYSHMWGHRFLFDSDSLSELLTEAGFIEVERVPFGESRHQELRGTDTHAMGALDSIVLCMDAVKPSRTR
jgi:predicted SAM-dependent methyltransferase